MSTFQEGKSDPYATQPLLIQAELNRGLEFHRSGQFAEAEKIYRSILKTELKHFDAAHLLGVIALQRGQFETAERQIHLAIRINPNVAPPHNNRGNALRGLKRFEEALGCYDKAIALDPAYAEAFNNRGAVLDDLERFTEALASYDRAIALKADYATAFNNRGNTLKSLERFSESLVSFDRAIALKPDYAAAFSDRGAVLHDLNRFDEALACCDKAIALNPNWAPAIEGRGNALKELGRLNEALACYDRALALQPDYAKAFNNRGAVLHDLNRLEEALTSYDQAIALRPNYATALDNRGHCRLLLGHMPTGWADYEHRWNVRTFRYRRPSLKVPHWSGEDLKGRSILIYNEQGLGDVIQFCRYLPLLAEKGASVTFLGSSNLFRILGTLAGQIRCITTLKPEHHFDVQCALMSLPHRFGTDLSNIPSSTPYLAAEPERSAAWRKTIGTEGFRVGICWHGKPVLVDRSIQLHAFYPISQIPGVRLISLQKNYGLEQLAALPADMKVETLGDDFDAGPDRFIDTAAVMEHLDLVISCDTSIAHLAGALGQPTWVALKWVPDWRWLLERNDSPWYPKMRLFRQKTNDWSLVFQDMAEALTKFLAPAAPGPISPDESQTAQAELLRGIALHQCGQLVEAEQIYLSTLRREPKQFDATHLLGVIYLQRRQFKAAEEQIGLAIQINPRIADAYNNLGQVLEQLERLDEALARYDTALALRPDYLDALNNRGNVLRHLHRHNEALASYNKAIARKPDYAEAFSNRGAALNDIGRHDEALADHDKAIALKPDYAEAFTNRGTALHDLKRLDEAIASHDTAIALRPDFFEAINNRAHCRLLIGAMAKGWSDYEYRWNAKHFPYKRPSLDAPHWAGEDLQGRSILVYSEQGIGDIFQFCRYLPLLADLGANVSFLVSANLIRILKRLRGRIRFIPALKVGHRFDFQCPLMSLPYRMGTDLTNIPASPRYFHAKSNPSDRWATIGSDGFKVGICWQSKPVAPLRSFPLRQLYPLSQLSGVRLISLQKNHGLDQLATLPHDMKIHAFGDDFDGGPDAFVDTAGLMEHLDLIITSDTSIAHLAGALGRPTWVALRYVPEWRWLLDRSDSPWYPTLRLFRQEAPNDWNGVFRQMMTELTKLVPGTPGRRQSVIEDIKL